jgi:hypothetical protein
MATHARERAASPVIACCSSLAAMNELPTTPTTPTTIHALCTRPHATRLCKPASNKPAVPVRRPVESRLVLFRRRPSVRSNGASRARPRPPTSNDNAQLGRPFAKDQDPSPTNLP